jgi:sec-independent protein translocase protein TatA
MFGSKSLVHWIIVGVVFLLLFGGRNKISDLMGDVARGIKSFKKGLSDDDAASPAPTTSEAPRGIEYQRVGAAPDKSDVRRAG